MLEISCLVDIGKRPYNDDRAAVNSRLITLGSYTETTEKSCFVVVCDGVGGEKFGNEAAEIVAESFSRISEDQISVDVINETIKAANEAIITDQKKDIYHSKMATTIAGLYINEDDFIAFNIGDSRIYRYRSFISQISKDHSLWQEQINSGLSPQQGQESVITRYLGGKFAVPEIVEGTGRVFDNDIYIVCTDGVWGSLKDEDFEKILSENAKTEDMCQSLIDLALQNGSQDNLSIIIVRRT